MTPTHWTKKLGKSLRSYRKLQKLTQQQLADKLAINKNTIYRLEKGENVNTFVLFKVLDYFDLAESFINSIPDLRRIKIPKDFDKF